MRYRYMAEGPVTRPQFGDSDLPCKKVAIMPISLIRGYKKFGTVFV